MKISTKITGLTGSIVLVNILAGCVAMYSLRQQQNESRLLVEESMTVCRSIIDINRYHHDHNLKFSTTVGVGEREVQAMEGLEEFNASVKEFRATCGEFDTKVFASLKRLDSLCQSDALPKEFLSNFKMLRDELVAMHEEHEVCMPHTQAVFDYIQLGDVPSAKERAEIVWADEERMKKGIDELVEQQSSFGQNTLEAAEARQDRILIWLVGIFGFSLFVGVWVSWYTSGRIVRSLKHAVGVARRIAEGDRSVNIRKFTDDESGELLDSMQQMLRSLNRAENKLKNHNERLERKVQERTLELAESNNHLRDEVDERKAKERQLREINQELNHFLYRTSHDLKGPVSSIQGLINVAQLEVNDPKAKEYFGLVCNAASQLDTILLSLIDIARIRQDQPSIEAVDFQKITEEIFAFCQTVPGFETINLHTEIDCSTEFYSDQELLCTIFKAIVTNAIQYQKQVGASHFEFRVFDDDESLVVIAKDNGVGIAPDMIDHVFELFFRGNNRSGGTGMGLFMVQEAVKKLNGSVKLESTAGVGTSLHMRFPRVEARKPRIPVAV
ncbi:MAG: ATP-binding protein [Salibacteraceae bacterium]